MRALGIVPTPRGLAYAVLENGDKLVYWGIKNLSKRNKASRRKFGTKHYIAVLEGLVEFYQPDSIVFEDARDKSSRRGRRVKNILRHFAEFTAKKNIPTYEFSRQRLLSAFKDYDINTKHELALFLARLFPELQPIVPKKRKPWMSEPPQVSIFVALAHCIALKQ